MLLTLIIITTPFILLLSSFLGGNNGKSSEVVGGLSAIQITYILSYFLEGNPTLILTFKWLGGGLQTLEFSFLIDTPFILFSGVALFVSWAILGFSHYYMETDPNNDNFRNILLLFLFFMLILTSANNLFLLFVGWEGVGILSFILIGWWHSRTNANSSALQAIIYNRVGDVGMLIFLATSIITLNSWNLSELLILSSTHPLSLWALLGIIIGASGKSAQFCLHPWLPAAMEGPTPVSALLHSSTMVVAGVFLLIRCSSLFSNSTITLYILIILGSITSLFAGSAAIFQYDIKKIIAYSTTSQLGIMIIAIGLNLPLLAIFHICTHAFFKALLFLCSGSLIHSLNNEQDIRRMGNILYSLPFTSSCLIIGSLALCGFPFLAGFYSKDLIIEASYSIINLTGAALTIILTILTIIYSLRLIYFLTLSPTISISSRSEENQNLTFSLLRLTIGAITAGWLLSLFLFEFPPNILLLLSKILPLTLFIFLFYLTFNTFYPSIIYSFINTQFLFFCSSSWFYSTIFHGSLWRYIHSFSISGVLRSLDQGWLYQLGPGGIINFLKTISTTLQSIHFSSIINYFWFSSLLLIFLLLIFSAL